MTRFFKGQKDSVEAVARVIYEDDNGDEQTNEFVLKFKPIGTRTQAQLQQLTADSPDTISKALELLEDHIVGWEEVYDEKNKPVRFTKDALSQLLDVPMYFQAALNAMIAQETPEKNS